MTASVSQLLTAKKRTAVSRVPLAPGLAQELLLHGLLQQVEWQRSLRDDEVVIAVPVEASRQRELEARAQSVQARIAIEVGSRLARRLERIAVDFLFRHRLGPVSYTHLRAHETPEHLVC